jgi:lactate racemase
MFILNEVQSGTIMPIIKLPYGENTLSFFIDENRLGDVVTPAPTTPVTDPATTIMDALARPLGTPPLHQILAPGQRVALIIDDITRETPGRLILPIVLKEMGLAGIRREDISIVMALGTHRPMTPSEIEAKIGPELARYRVINTPASDMTTMTYMGRSSGGVPIWVNRAVAEADVRIGIGSIVPHLDAGWGGGAKIVLPGVCGALTVEAFHEKIVDIPDNQLGLEDAVLRIDLEKFVGETIGLEFIVNVVLDGESRLYGCVTGHYIKAHRAGVALARDVYGVAVESCYPLVIAGAHPHHIDLWQSTKALAAGEIITAPGGTLILAAECPEGLGSHPLFADYLSYDEERLLRDFHEGRVDDRVAAVEALAIIRMKQRFRIGLVSWGLTAEDARCMGLTWYNTLEEAVKAETSRNTGIRVAVITHGGVTLPIRPSDV